MGPTNGIVICFRFLAGLIVFSGLTSYPIWCDTDYGTNEADIISQLSIDDVILTGNKPWIRGKAGKESKRTVFR